VSDERSQRRRRMLKQMGAGQGPLVSSGAVGAPPALTWYHARLAAHLLWRRNLRDAQGKPEPLKASYSKVAESWGVTRPQIEQCVKKHKTEAAGLAAIIDELNFGQFADAFRKLSDPDAEAAAQEFRKQER
jgi:hypothetical protein